MLARPTIRRFAVVAFAAGACRSPASTAPPIVAERALAATPVAPAPTLRASLSGLDRALGDPPLAAIATAGHYAAEIRRARTEFITMEIVTHEGVDGRATLDLDDDGRAVGCFASRWSETTTRGKYATKSGVDETTESKHRTFVGARGGWTIDSDGWLRVHFARARADACPPPATIDRLDSRGDLELACVALRARAPLTTPLLLCSKVAGSGAYVDDLALPIATATTTTTAPAQWLLLGGDGSREGGAALTLTTGAHAATPTLAIAPKAVTLTPSMWLKDD